MPYNRCYTLSHVSRLFVLGSIILLGLAMSSCASSDDPTSQGAGTEDISSNTNTGVALNHINANVMEASVQGFTRGAVPEDTASPGSMPTASDGGLTCDVAWGAPGTTRAANTGYNMQWANIGSSTSIAILPRGAAVGAYSYTVSTAGAISSSSPYYFQTASNDVVTSWYPYNSGSLSSFTVQSDQSTLANYIASDLLYTSSKVTATSQNLTYSHKMAQVIVDVTVSNANYLLNSDVQSLTIAGLKTNCTVTNYTKSTNEVCTPTFTAGSTTATISAYRYSKSSTSTTSTATFIMCVPAQTISTSQVFTVTVGGTAYTGKLSNAQSLEWGSAYNISITFDGKATMVYPSGNTIAVGDYYGMAVNGQAVVVKNASISSASSKGITLSSVVFSTITSSTDQGHGWTHGYAMALQNAGNNSDCNWSLNTTDSPIPNMTKEFSVWKSYYDGYTESHLIGTSSDYPAFYYALTYDNTVKAPLSSSKWYLPSNGQMYLICRNLGNMTAEPSSSSFDPSNGVNNYSWGSYAGKVDKQIDDSYLTPVSSYATVVTLCSTRYGNNNNRFWCSCETAANFPFSINFGVLHIYTNAGTRNQPGFSVKVRPVLAF